MEINCPICSSEVAHKIFDHDIFLKGNKVVECDNCDFIYLKNQLDDRELFQFYNNRYRDHKQEANDYNRIYNDLDRAISQYFFYSPFIVAPKSVLEIGGGWGTNANFLKSKGFSNITVNEFDDQVTEFLEPGIKRIAVPLEESSGNNDFIFLSHVLEHFFSLREKIDKLWDLLNPWGKLFIEVPNCQNEKVLNVTPNAYHYWYFKHDDLLKLFEGEKWNVLNIETYGKDRIFSKQTAKNKKDVDNLIASESSTMGIFPHDDPRGFWLRIIVEKAQ